jgi:hypothetical protein
VAGSMVEGAKGVACKADRWRSPTTARGCGWPRLCLSTYHQSTNRMFSYCKMLEKYFHYESMQTHHILLYDIPN